MAITQKMNGRAMSIPGGVMFGAAVSLLWTLVASAILAKLIDIDTLNEQSIGYGSMIILLTASMLGSGIALGKIKRQRALVCIAAGSMYLLMLMAITALFFGGQYRAIGVTAILVIAGSSVTLLWSVQRERKRSHTHYKTRRK